MKKKIRVLILDRSPVCSNKLTYLLSKDRSITVVGAAKNPYEARDKIVLLNVNFLIIDPDLDKMDGIQFIKQLMPQFPIPIIIFSKLDRSKEGKDVGALDFIFKPDNNDLLETIVTEMITKIKISSTIDLSHWKSKRKDIKNRSIKPFPSKYKVIAIGASTGGTEALKKVIPLFPINTPPVVVVQHMPSNFTKMFAQSLNRISKVEVKEAETGDILTIGKVFIAPGDFHLTVSKASSIYQLICKKGEKVSGHRPSVDVLMDSVAKTVEDRAIGVILTGMGRDGALGILKMKQQGAITIAQDEKSSVIFGMPKEAINLGGVDIVTSIYNITNTIIKILKGEI